MSLFLSIIVIVWNWTLVMLQANHQSEVRKFELTGNWIWIGQQRTVFPVKICVCCFFIVFFFVFNILRWINVLCVSVYHQFTLPQFLLLSSSPAHFHQFPVVILPRCLHSTHQPLSTRSFRVYLTFSLALCVLNVGRGSPLCHFKFL